MGTERQELAIIVTARDLASKVMRGVASEGKALERSLGKGLASAAGNVERLAIAGAGLAVAGLGAAVKVAGDFEEQLHTINTVAAVTPDQLDAIGLGIRKLARTTGTDLGDLTSAYYDLVSAGIKTADAQNVLTAANTLAIGGLATTAETVDLLTTAINAYGGDASRAGEYADDFAKAIELGKVKASEIAASFADVGAIAAQNGISVREVAESYAFLTSQGIPAAEVTTQMSRAILELLKPGADLEALQKKLGKNYSELAKNDGLVPALQELRTDAEKAGIPLVNLFGRVEGFKYLLETTGPNFEKFSGITAQFGNDAGTAARQMAERQQGLNFQLARLKQIAIDTGITIGSKLLPKLTPLLEQLSAFVEGHQGDISKFGDDLAKGFGDAAAYLGEVDWAAVGGGLKIAADGAKGIVDAFLGAPPWVQEFLVAGFAVNKFTGGAAADIVGELGKGLIKGVLGMNAGVVNINAGVVRTGTGLPGVSALPGGLSTLSKVFLVGEAIGLVLAVSAVNDSITAQNSLLAANIHQTEHEFAKDATVKDLQTGLDSVNAGIEALSHDPIAQALNLAGARDAMTQLQAMQDELRAAIQVRTGGVVAPDRADGPSAIVGSVDKVYDILEDVRDGVKHPPIGRVYDYLEEIRTGIIHPAPTPLSPDAQERMRDQTAATNRVYDAIEARRAISVAVNFAVTTNISSRDIVTTTTQNKILAGGIEVI